MGEEVKSCVLPRWWLNTTTHFPFAPPLVSGMKDGMPAVRFGFLFFYLQTHKISKQRKK